VPRRIGAIAPLADQSLDLVERRHSSGGRDFAEHPARLHEHLFEIKGETPPFALPTAQPKKERDEKPFVPPQKKGTNPTSKPRKGRSRAAK